MIWFKVGTLVSLVAALIIEVFLVLVLAQGISVVCSPIGLSGGLVLLGLAFIALYSYIKSSSYARVYMIYLAPLGILLGFVAWLMVLVGYSCPMGPIGFLALAYVIESIVGYKLRFDLELYSRVAATLFTVGILGFTLGLILLMVSVDFIVVSLAGNTVKLLSLTWLTLRVLKAP